MYERLELAPAPAFVARRVGAYVRTNTDFLKCVAFIGLETERGHFIPMGTCFFTSWEYEGFVFQFLTTAAHVLDGLPRDEFVVRLNTAAGVAQSLKVSRAEATFHADRNNDVAMIPMALNVAAFDIRLLNLNRAQINHARETVWGIAQGDEVHAVGLYTSHHGLTRNIPVLRVGTLATLLDEPVSGPNGKYVEGYLIELRTIAGLSGSPVFVAPPPIRYKDGQAQFLASPPILPLGILIGYHLVASKDDQISVPRFQEGKPASADEGDPYSLDERNTGFGIVIPIERLLDIVESDAIQVPVKAEIQRSKTDAPFKPAGANKT